MAAPTFRMPNRQRILKLDEKRIGWLMQSKFLHLRRRHRDRGDLLA